MQCPRCAASAGPGVAVCAACGLALDGASAHFPDDSNALTIAAPPSAARRPSGPLAIGQSFGRYQVRRMLGMGGMGAVYEAWDSELEVAVAVKVIRPDVTFDPRAASEIERRFKRELLLARQVTHPNVVRIHDLGEMDGIKYITMPYIEGTDLSQVLKVRPSLPLREALPIARQIAEGLDAAHRAGVVHRDLKPANIMIDGAGRALIMDFGIARGGGKTDIGGGGARTILDSGEETRLGAVVGTVEYMAPEQARGELVDHRADIYAFGLILYRLLGGRRTAPVDPLADLTARMNTEPTPLRKLEPSVPETVERIVSRCLQPDRERRYQATSELVEALRAIDDNGVRRPAGRQLLKTWRFRLTAAAVIAAAVVVAVVGTRILERRRAAATPPAERDPVAVLVADSVNSTGEPVFDGFIEQALTLGVEGAPFVSAYQRPAALRVARLLKAGDKLDESTARLVAVREGVRIVLAGGIAKTGSGYMLSVRKIDPTDGNVLAAIEEQAANRDGVLNASGVLAAKVRSDLGDTRAADARETFSSSSIEAVSAYIKAQELSSAGRDQNAIEHYRRAAELDPGFGRAFGGWAMSATRLGRREEAEKLWKQALEQTERMSPRERFRLEGAYFTLVTRNYDKAIETYSTLVKAYPADGAGHNNLAVGYFRRLEFAKALEEGRRVIDVYPGSALYRTNYALFAMYAGDFALAEKTARELVDEEKATYDTFLPLAIGAVAQGRLDAARDAYGRMEKVDSNGASLAAIGLADLALAEGRNADAVSILRQGIAEDRRTDNLAGVASKQIALADALGTQGNTKDAVAAALVALEIDRTEAQAVPAAAWLIAAGRVDEAAKLGAELDARLEPHARAYGRIIAGQIALARGKRVEALDALREALKLADLWLVRFYLGQVYLTAGHFHEALSEFQLCLERSGEGYATFLDDVPSARRVATVPYWIGRAKEGPGGTTQARTDYEAFLKNRAADASDVLTKDARARLTALPDRGR